MKIPANVVVKCLELAGEKPAKPTRRDKPELVEPQRNARYFTWTIPLVTVNETNDRVWQSRNRRAGQAWKAVRKVIKLRDIACVESCADNGEPVRIVFTRLGGRKLDRGNLPAALKGVEDAVSYLLGVDDGSPLWQAEYRQEPGPGGCGVRIEIK